MQTLMLDAADVGAYSQIGEIIDAVEQAFDAYENGRTQMPEKSYITLEQYEGDFRSMPAYLDAGEWDAAGIKWVNVHPRNPEQFDLPTVIGTMIYSDPETAVPLAILDGTALTRLRTGAAAAVATDYLAVEDATTMGIIGAGVQSYTQLEAIASVRPISEVIVSDPDDSAVRTFIDHFSNQFDVRPGRLEEATKCDVLSTTTPTESPIVSQNHLGKKTHVNAMGADAKGKQELDSEVLLDAKLVIDDHGQATHSGECNVPYAEGTITDDDIYAELGEIVAETTQGRTEEDGVTVFDSTGLAIQDVAAAHVVYQNANAGDAGQSISLVDMDQ
jgi:alanine dehydrogenase